MEKKRDLGSAELTPEEREGRLLSTAGLAARARRIVIGTELLCDGLRSGQVCFVLLASDASENTKKRVTDKSAYYGVPLCCLRADCATLARVFGKKNGSIAAVGITDGGIVRAMRKYLPGDPIEAPVK